MSKAVALDTRDLYDDPSVKTDEVLKPLTAVVNKYAPREGIHLYQFCGSFFSCEARLLLEEKGVSFTSHDVCIVNGVYDQYKPEYVRINPRCVVPTLVVDGKVTTDAHNMIVYAEDTGLGGPDAPKLVPADAKERELAQRFFDLAAGIFIEALTYGEVPGGPKIPFPLSFIMKGNHECKREALESMVDRHRDDAYLKSAYEAKLRILNTQMGVLDSDKTLEEIARETKEAMKELNRQLKEGPAKDGTGWLCSKTYSHADMLWGLTLHRLRLRNYGDFLWRDLPAVDAYADRLIARPAFQKAVVPFQTPAMVLRKIAPKKLAAILRSPSATAITTAGIAAIAVALIVARRSNQ